MRSMAKKRWHARTLRGLGWGGLRALAWLALFYGCGDDDHGGGADDGGRSTDNAVAPASCDPGKVAACTGTGDCAGTQVCLANGRYGACDCSGGAPRGDGGSAISGRDGSASNPSGPTACGTACTSDTDCGGGVCVEEQKGSSDIQGLGALPFSLFPGGMCSQTPLAEYQSSQACDPTVEGTAQGCGSCGVCTPVVFADAVATVCREKCTPSATASGCSRPEYTCSFGLGACVEGCASDEECRVYTRDTDSDGLGDMSFYDATSMAHCNTTTRRCQVTGKAGAQAGDPCMRDDDCEADGFCLTADRGDFDPAFSGGYCSKTGCKVAGLACAGQGQCAEPRSWDPSQALGTLCVHGCQQGMEMPAEQFGAMGHGAGCRAGYMCLWNGANDTNGTCIPGNYNAVTANNVGSACTPAMRGADCYSPFGHGRCLTFGSSTANASLCSILDCNAPGLPDDICGAGNACVRFDEDLSGCFHVCTDASQCGASLACVASSASGPKICVFGCQDSTECRPGETCSRDGACTAPAAR